MTSFPSGGAYVIEDTETGSSRFSSSNTQNVIAIQVPLVSGGNGAVGLTGATGPGVATGGTTGQFLTKDSGTDYDTSWATIHQVPAGGATAEVLGKASGTDYDLEWVAQTPAATTGYVYNSSAVQAGNVYSSWSDLITQLSSVDGPKTVRFQQDETIPTGAWDLNQATLVGNGGTTVTGVRLTFPTGCTISNPGYLMATDGIILYSTSTSAVLTLSSARTMVFENDAIVCSKTAAFFTISATSGSVIFSLRNGAGITKPSDISIAGGDYESVNVTGAGCALNVVDSCGFSNLNDDVIRGGAGSTLARVIFSPVDFGSTLGDTQTNANNWSIVLGVTGGRVRSDAIAPIFSADTHVEHSLLSLQASTDGAQAVRRYLFDASTTMADPGAGEVRINNADPTLATVLAFDDDDADSEDLATLAATLAAGDRVALTCLDGGDTSQVKYRLTAPPTLETGYFTVPVVNVDSYGPLLPFTAATSLHVLFAYKVSAGSTLPTPGTTGNLLTSDGSAWTSAADRLPAASTSGNILTSNGSAWTSAADRLPAAGTSGNILTSNGTTWASSAPAKVRGSIQLSPFSCTTTTLTATTSTPYLASTADGQYAEWTYLWMDAGTYNLILFGQNGSDRAIQELLIDTVSKGTYDWYNATTTITGPVTAITGFTVSTSGLKTVRLAVNGRNGSSSGWVTRTWGLTLLQTA